MSIYDLPTGPPQEEPQKPVAQKPVAQKPEPQKPEPKVQPQPTSTPPAKPASSIYAMPTSAEPEATPAEPTPPESSTKAAPTKSASTKELAEKVRQAAQQPKADLGESTQSVYNSAPPEAEAAKKSRKRRRAIGCLGVLLLPLLLGGIGAGVVAWKWSSWLHGSLVEAIEDSSLSAADKTAVVGEIDRLYEGYRAGEIDGAQLMEVAEAVGKSPLSGLLLAYAVHERYLVPSGLPQSEKDAGYTTLKRVAQGFYEKRITRRQLNPALDFISVEEPDGNRSFHSLVLDDDLRAMLAECQTLADTARVPLAPTRVDVGARFQKAVQQGLATEQIAAQ